MAKGKKYLHGRKKIALGRGAENRINLPLLRQVQRIVEDLQAGDRVIPRDNGFQEIAWVGSKTMSSLDFARDPKPVFVKAGFLGNGLPERDMLLSPRRAISTLGSNVLKWCSRIGPRPKASILGFIRSPASTKTPALWCADRPRAKGSRRPLAVAALCCDQALVKGLKHIILAI
ncbi:Hint domain-containing protein [Cypionkella sp.]|uniref:Hint domain-containing protein n=1 Tax=Cypionkella sp. TaxID=2811411 RepID=UPI00374E521C